MDLDNASLPVLNAFIRQMEKQLVSDIVKHWERPTTYGLSKQQRMRDELSKAIYIRHKKFNVAVGVPSSNCV